MNDPKKATIKTVYSFDLTLILQRQHRKDRKYPVQAGLAFLDLSKQPTDPPDRQTAHWTNEEFFVPPSLWGAGLGERFLEKLLQQLKKEQFNRCEVTVKSPETTDKAGREWLERTDLASRQQLNELLAFYQRAGFWLEAKNRLARNLEYIIVSKPERSRAP